MADITIDTSGYVLGPEENRGALATQVYHYFEEMPPFVQGYLVTLLRSITIPAEPHFDPVYGMVEAAPVVYGFSDLAGETVEAALRDCEEYRRRFHFDDTAIAGEAFWKCRQIDQVPDLPPLTHHLGDDGKVRLR